MGGGTGPGSPLGCFEFIFGGGSSHQSEADEGKRVTVAKGLKEVVDGW